jgi:hypothetical protein
VRRKSRAKSLWRVPVRYAHDLAVRTAVVYKDEVVRAASKELKDNARFVVTNLPQSPQWIYEKVYCSRVDVENRI